ncbi:MAG TPA: FAD-dependent oxidoreductase [Conexivisphaerales archaeon]|nr:FAD-dependent oxidoreductase [Conexivisphaerales archaeon]
MTEKFDAAVVGAGPAGITAAYMMAKAGVGVVVIERGEFPGSKNVIGGVFYVKTLDDILPGFWKEAPLERNVVQHSYCLMGRRDFSTISYRHTGPMEKPNGFTVLRSKFDRWYAKKAEEAGATIVLKTNVTELLREGGKVVGVRTDRGDLMADVTVVSEGANTMLSEGAGLIGKPRPDQMAVAVREIISLPADRIQERFGLREGEGAAIHYLGSMFRGLVGFGFVYTNRDSLSVGLGATISTMMKAKVRPYDLMERFKEEPSVASYVAGGLVKEYQAHMIPEGGYGGMPTLAADGVLVAGDSAMLANPVTGEGADLAVLSGRLAGETASLAKKARDYSARYLGIYTKSLRRSFAVRDMKKQAGLLHYIEENVDIIDRYPEAVNAALEEWFRVDGATRGEKVRRIEGIVISKRRPAKLLRDLFTLGRKLV